MLIVTLPHASDFAIGSNPAGSGASAASTLLNRELDYAVASPGFALTGHGSASLALLPKSEQTLLLLPASAVSWHKITLPKLPRGTAQARLRAVLDGLMEDQVLDDTAQLHLALWRQSRADGAPQDWVAACDKAWLASALAQFAEAGHTVTAIAPQSMPLSAAGQLENSELVNPLSGAQMSIHLSGDADHASIHLCDADSVLWLPAQAAASVLQPGSGVAPQSVSAEPAVAAEAEAMLARLLPEARVVIRSVAQHAVSAVQIAQTAQCNLAQFDLSVAGGARWLQNLRTKLREVLTLPAWRPARVGLVALLAAHLLGLNAWAWKEKSNLADKRTRVQQLLTTTFPQVKVVVDAPVQMQREVANLSQISGTLTSRDMEHLLASFSAIAPANKAQTAIDYIAGELGVKGSGLSSEQLTNQAAQWQAAGISGAMQGDRLVITPARSTDRVARSSNGTSTGTAP